MVSTAGNEFSAYFRGKVDEGRARCEMGVTGASAYTGYSAPDDADPGDPATWAGVHARAGDHGVRGDGGGRLRDHGTELSSAAAYLCQWPEVASPGWKLFTEDDWKEAVR